MDPTVWYYVRDLDGARSFYRETLGFEETAVDFSERWSHLKHGEMEIGLAEGEPRDDGTVAHVEVTDLKLEADRLRALVDSMLGPSAPPRKVSVNIHELCEHVFHLLRSEAAAADPPSPACVRPRPRRETPRLRVGPRHAVRRRHAAGI